MIAEKSTRSISSAAAFETHSFGIKSHNLSHVIDIIQNRLYSDKITAVIREYSTNGVDANRMAGKGHLPVKITLPSRFEQTIRIRDFGTGLTKQEMIDIYISYGESTKRNSNESIGTLGIGAKCYYSYSDNFLVISYTNGSKTTYNCVLDESNCGKLIVLNTEETAEPDGIEIVGNVKTDDIQIFRDKANNFFKHWEKGTFEITGYTDEDYTNLNKDKEILSGTNWKLVANEENRYSYGQGKSYALMGSIAYPIVWENIKWGEFWKNNNDNKFEHFIKSGSFLLNFNIGDIKMSPSRESLEYVEKTNKAILERVAIIVKEVTAECQKKINTATNLWDAKVLFDSMFTYGSALYNLQGNMVLNYKGVKIDNNQIKGFDKDAYKNFNKGNGEWFVSYDKKSVGWSKRIRSYILCAKNHAILIIDQEKKVYPKLALNYLENKNGTKSFNVFYLANKAERDTILTEMLNDVPYILYSSISDAVAATRVKTVRAKNGTTVTVNVDKNVRQIRSADIKNQYGYYGYKVSWNCESKDLSDGGVYVQMEDGKAITTDEYQMMQRAKFIHDNIDPNFGVLYGINSVIRSGKAWETNKVLWTEFDTYFTDAVTKFINKTAKLRLYMAYRKCIETGDAFEVECHFSEWVKKTYKTGNLTEMADLHNRKYAAMASTIGKYFTASEKDVKTIKDLFLTLNTKYDILGFVNEHFSEYGTKDGQKEKIKKYLDSW